MDWIRCVGCEKLQRDFVARTFALIAPVLSVLQQVSCSYETIPNATKYYETHQNISLGCNRADWVHSLWKILAWLRGTNFCINCTSSPRFAPNLQLRNNPKCTEILWNAPKHEFRVQWGGSSAFSVKILTRLWAQTFAVIAQVQLILHKVSCNNELIPNAPKHYETDQKLGLGSNGVDWVRS